MNLVNFQLFVKLFQQRHINYSFHVQERQWTTSRGYAAESARDAVQRDILLDRTWLVCHAHTTLRVQCVHGLDSKFAKLF